VDILYIEDDDLLRFAFQRLFKKYAVQVAENGAAALDLLQGHWFDVVVCDMMLTDMLGLDVFQSVNEKDPAQAERFIFVSGGFSEPLAKKLRSLPNEFIPKPWSRDVLEAAFSRVSSDC